MVAAGMVFVGLSSLCAQNAPRGSAQVFIDTFHFYYDQLVHGATGFITRDDAGTVGDIPRYESSARRNWRPATRR